VYTGFWRGNLRERDHSKDTKRRWEDNIKVDIQDVGWGMGGHGLDLYGSGHGHVAGTCESGNEPSGSMKCGSFMTS